jgi:hypothetical protein
MFSAAFASSPGEGRTFSGGDRIAETRATRLPLDWCKAPLLMDQRAGTMENLTKRQILMIVAALLTAGALVVGATIFVLQRFVLDDSDDPLAQAGGLKPSQQAR